MEGEDGAAHRRASLPRCGAVRGGEGGGEGGLVGGFEECSAGHEGVRAGGVAVGPGGEIDAAVHFEAKSERAFPAPRGELRQLG